MNSILKTNVSLCGSHHVTAQEKKLYDRNFDHVLPFHAVSANEQLAPVTVNGKAWHILQSGEPAYNERYDTTFGFYCERSAVINDGQWFHISSNGKPVYEEKYSFTGNFQQDICVVCDNSNNYFHIDKQGTPLYSEKWNYCGDFREGSSVVQSNQGLSTHISKNGDLLHNQWFLDLDVFHKGCARARDNTGWYHINKNGTGLYATRYANIEPYYNGCSRVEDFTGALLIIDERGNTLRIIRESKQDFFAELSADMVGYWKTFTIAAAVELNLCNSLPAASHNLALQTSTDESKLIRLLRALTELGIATLNNDIWSLTVKGQYLKSDHELSLSTAAIEYKNDLLQRWYELPLLIKGKDTVQNIFEEVDKSKTRRNDHHKMLRSYALHDYRDIIKTLQIQPQDTVFDAAGGNGALCELIKDEYPNVTIILGDMPKVINEIASDKFTAQSFDLFKQWPVKVDKIILSRILHDWNDEQAIHILRQAKSSLNKNGKILILEMLLQESSCSGSLCDLHLLAVTGGQERTHRQFELLAMSAGLRISSVKNTDTITSLIELVLNDD